MVNGRDDCKLFDYPFIIHNEPYRNRLENCWVHTIYYFGIFNVSFILLLF